MIIINNSNVLKIINIDIINNEVEFFHDNKYYKRVFKTSYDTKNKNFGYIFFRFKNEIYKFKKYFLIL